jgi:hypothetical protein
MKYLKKFNESVEDIDSICKKYGIQNYTINGDGTVDVDGDVDLYNRGLTKLPLKFGKVSGNFYCQNNKLATLEGCPGKVGGNFWCQDNKLTTLEGCPGKVGGNFNCHNNKLTTLEGCPGEVGGNFWCQDNKLTTLEGCPKEVVDSFWCYNNKLTTLEGCPKGVGGDFYCSNNQLTIINDELEFVRIIGHFDIEHNPIHNVYKLFPNFKSFQYSLDYNYFRYPNQIVKNRFGEACGEAGISLPEKIKGYQYI